MVSYPVGTSRENLKGEYLGDYSLASSRVLVTISSPSAGGATTAAASTTPAVNFTSAITVSTVAPEQKPAAAKAEANVCADIRKTYNTDRMAPLRFVKNHADFAIQIDTWLSTPPTGEAKVNAALAVLDSFLADRAQDKGALVRAAQLQPLLAACPQLITVELKEVVEVDQDSTFHLYGNRAWLADNTIAGEFEGPYLKSINATGDDRTGDVLVEAAKSIAVFEAYGRPVDPKTFGYEGRAAMSAFIKVAGLDVIATLAQKIREDGFEADTLTQLKSAIEVESKAASAVPLPAIDEDLPLRKTYSISDLKAGQSPSYALNVTIKIDDCSTEAVAAEKAERRTSLTTKETTKYYGGVVSPATISCVIVASRDDKELARTVFAASDATHFQVLPLPKQLFVKQTSGYGWTAGRLTKADTTRPSPVVAWASIPFRIVGGAVGAVSDGIKGRNGVIDADKARIEAETARLKAAKALEDAKKPAADTAPATTTSTGAN
ncbi:hypothetical protein [uncultured Caulobacter sp.]|uniref:hypothetical protein n=1 Tax=uncultured Caulobacter sp. TaxID=158749 RepID=UPI0026381837|nr:hypothetical protein [uncultured Caulobacter sp.]